MPELPEVETIRKALDLALKGRTIKAVNVRSKGLRKPFPEDLAARLEGKKNHEMRPARQICAAGT